MLAYLKTLHRGVITLGALLNRLIHAVGVSVDGDAADIILALVRGHPVRNLEMQGQFAAFKQLYSERYHREA
ncbi:hypothetical protein MKK84_30925 [Methylobacterium sp. E-065]|uniref:hypothetical protein n=1 Tax=Methylobacterium sp. E-065 TaxID=2836583 RepID=UPI001FBBF67A|nr:hypothetical protein [Methylobacterium sp. E-065]MCJ2021775.1 hypothetical protein [Methylobacterium sp. E-065]